MMTNNIHGGTLRRDNEADLARLDNFPVMENDRDKLLHRLVKEGGLCNLLENHVLTVLADIRRKRLSDYGNTFADVHGTARLAFYNKKIHGNANNWIKRLDCYIHQSWKSGYAESIAVEIAKELEDTLKESLLSTDMTERDAYFRMLRTVISIQEQADYYRKQVEESGDTEPSLALLVSHLKNYNSVVEAFNHRFALLPELYYRNILHAVPKGVVQDNAYIVVTPMEDVGGFILPERQLFPAGQNAAGEDLIYQTTKEEHISPIRCVEVNAVYGATGFYKQSIPLQDADNAKTLFAHGEKLRIGWQVESSMLVLREGERIVNICFRLTADSTLFNSIPSDGFVVQLSVEEGWLEHSCSCRVEDSRLCFTFAIKHDEAASASCTEETHGMLTEYPAIRILTNNTDCPYEWANRLKFDAVEIRTEVSVIRNFNFYNELGEVDTMQSFSPFGIQAEHGAWFLFGNEEMRMKTLQEVHLKGKWKKLPETKDEFNKIYKEYGIDADSFIVSTECQKGGKWEKCGERQKLFTYDKNDKLDVAEVVFNFMTELPFLASSTGVSRYEYNRDDDGFFRATLDAPAIGFGMDTYRRQFTEVMIHNSRCKEKDRKDMPQEPVIAQLADVELSYIAVEKTALIDMGRSSIRLSRITAFSKQEAIPTDGAATQVFLPFVPADRLLYFALVRAQGEKNVRIYVDTTLPKERIPFGNPQPGQCVKMSWELWNGRDWQAIDSKSVKAEETCGLTQSGFVEIALQEKISDQYADVQGRVWIRAALTGDVSSCLAIRGIWTNCIPVTATNGDGQPLPAGTIHGLIEVDERIESIVQPMPGFGGTPAETEAQCAIWQSARIHNRHRAVTMKDYEQLVLEHFPEVDKAQCLSVPQKNAASEVCLVVFSRAEDNRYFLSPAWKLEEIRRTVGRYTSLSVPLRVVNPIYEQIEVYCKAVLWSKVQNEGKALRQLVVLAQNYIAPWYRKGEIPDLGQHYSYKELHARMANHEDLMRLVSLEVGGISLPYVDVETEDRIFKGSYPWSVLLPRVNIELLSPGDGIESAEIGGNFIIG